MTLYLTIRDINGIQALDILKSIDQKMEELNISDIKMEVHHVIEHKDLRLH